MRHSESDLSSRPPAVSARPSRRFGRLDWLVAGVFVALLAGCATGDYSLVAPVSGGTKVRVPIGPGGPVPMEMDGVKIEVFGLRPDFEKKQVLYTFGFFDARGRGLQDVKVEDVSDDTPFPLLEDAAPQVDKGHWHGTSRSFAAGDEYLKWIYQVDNSLRVYRFTVKFTDGHELVIHQGSTFPNFMKSAIRHMFGATY